MLDSRKVGHRPPVPSGITAHHEEKHVSVGHVTETSQVSYWQGYRSLKLEA